MIYHTRKQRSCLLYSPLENFLHIVDTQKIVDRMNTASGEKMSTKSKKLVFVSGVNNWDETQLSKDL